MCIGINDADYVINPTISGKQVICKIYLIWVTMINQCYNDKVH